MRRKNVTTAVAGAREVLLDTAGLGLLSAAAFTWSTTAGLVAAGLAVLGMNWRLSEGAE
ncbi:hypothetical protein ACIQ8D_23935 [Streptomyces sp. NPDC096094]|uniref:hypothetical protein n=1 Tax=Streptomyces sp. NPDC096094 TaxID=3366073 RepID=UPI0037F9F415